MGSRGEHPGRGMSGASSHQASRTGRKYQHHVKLEVNTTFRREKAEVFSSWRAANNRAPGIAGHPSQQQKELLLCSHVGGFHTLYAK